MTSGDETSSVYVIAADGFYVVPTYERGRQVVVQSRECLGREDEPTYDDGFLMRPLRSDGYFFPGSTDAKGQQYVVVPRSRDQEFVGIDLGHIARIGKALRRFIRHLISPGSVGV